VHLRWNQHLQLLHKTDPPPMREDVIRMVQVRHKVMGPGFGLMSPPSRMRRYRDLAAGSQTPPPEKTVGPIQLGSASQDAALWGAISPRLPSEVEVGQFGPPRGVPPRRRRTPNCESPHSGSLVEAAAFLGHTPCLRSPPSSSGQPPPSTT